MNKLLNLFNNKKTSMHEEKIRQAGGYDKGVNDTIDALLDAFQNISQPSPSQPSQSPKDPRKMPSSKPNNQDSQNGSGESNTFEVDPDMTKKKDKMTDSEDKEGE